MDHLLIIGGGGTGGALAHDLALRGFHVTLVEKGGLLSGTSGRHHGLLHSGARYALHMVQWMHGGCHSIFLPSLRPMVQSNSTAREL